MAASRSDSRRFWLDPVLLGAGLGAWAGAAAALFLFHLVDFSASGGDRFMLTMWAVGHGVLGGAGVGLLGAGLFGLVTRGARRHAAASNALDAVLCSGFVFSAVLVVVLLAARPVFLSDPWVVLSALGAAAAVAACALGGWRSQRRAQRHSRFAIVSLAIALVVPILATPLVRSSPPSSSEEMPPRNALGDGRRVLLLGWDGATWDVLRPLLAAGRLPNLARLLPDAASGTLWAPVEPIQPFADSASRGARSPAIWETLATGKDPRVHGIWDFRVKLVHGVEQPIPFRVAGEYLGETRASTGELRRSKRVWEILEDAGVSTAVVGWLSTWPVEAEAPGIVVSERAFHGDADAARHADGIDFAALRLAAHRELQRRHPDLGRAPELAAYRTEMAHDLFKLKAALAIEETARPELLAIAFRSTDVAQHQFWRDWAPESFGLEASDRDAVRAELIPAAYELLDEALGELLAARGGEDTIVLFSDHGAGAWVAEGLGRLLGEGFRAAYHPEYSGNHRLNGIVLLHGPDIATGGALPDAAMGAITPTVLRLFGLPHARDMAAGPLDDGLVAAPAAEEIATFEGREPRQALAPSRAESDEALLERLRSLGYVR